MCAVLKICVSHFTHLAGYSPKSQTHHTQPSTRPPTLHSTTLNRPPSPCLPPKISTTNALQISPARRPSLPAHLFPSPRRSPRCSLHLPPQVLAAAHDHPRLPSQTSSRRTTRTRKNALLKTSRTRTMNMMADKPISRISAESTMQCCTEAKSGLRKRASNTGA